MPHLRLFEQSSNSFDHFASFLAIANNSLRSLASLGDISRLCREPPQASVTVSHDRSQWLIDFMRDRRSQLPNRGNLRRSGEARLGVTQRLFDSLSVIDIDKQAIPLCNVALSIEHCLAEHVEPAITTIMSAQPVLHVMQISRPHIIGPYRYRFLNIIR